jgi:hypothetical protein
MRWRWVNFTQTHVPQDLWDFRTSLFGRRMMRRSGTGTRVPAWVWDLYEVTYVEAAVSWGTQPERDPRPLGIFNDRLQRAAFVVNKPGGIDPEVFSSALRLGGWVAVQALHAFLRPAPRLSPESG